MSGTPAGEGGLPATEVKAREERAGVCYAGQVNQRGEVGSIDIREVRLP